MNQDFDSHEFPADQSAFTGFNQIPEKVLEDLFRNVENASKVFYSKYKTQFLELLRAREYRKEQYCNGSVPYFVDRHESHAQNFCIGDKSKLSAPARAKSRLEEDRRFTYNLNPYDLGSLEKAIAISSRKPDLDFCFDFSMEPLQGGHFDAPTLDFQTTKLVPALLLLMGNTKIYFRTSSISADQLQDLAEFQIISETSESLINFGTLKQVVLFASLIRYSEHSKLHRNIAMHLQISDIRTWQEARLWKKLLTQLGTDFGLEPGKLLVDIVFDNLEACFQPQEILFEMQDFVDGIILDDCRKLVQLEELFGTTNKFPLIDTKKQVLFQKLDHVHFFVEIAHQHGLHCLFQERWTSFKSIGLGEKVIADRLNRLFRSLSSAGFDGCFFSDLRGLDSARLAFRRKSQLHRYNDAQSVIKKPTHWVDFVDFATPLEIGTLDSQESENIIKSQLDAFIVLLDGLGELNSAESFKLSNSVGVSFDELKVLRQNVLKMITSGIDPDKSFSDTLTFLKCKFPERSKLSESNRAFIKFLKSLDLPSASSVF